MAFIQPDPTAPPDQDQLEVEYLGLAETESDLVAEIYSKYEQDRKSVV